MKNQRWICLILSLLMVCSLAACGTAPAPAQNGDSTPAPTPAESVPAASAEPESTSQPGGEEDGQNPIMNFIGSYACGRANIDVTPDGMDGAKFLVHWGSSARESANWEMSGKLDPETLVLSYSDCKKYILTFSEDGESSTETVEYENGTGTFTFNVEDYSLTWQDDQENAAENLVFTYASAAPEDADFYSVATSFEKVVVEGFAADVRRAVLDEDWETLSHMIAYPLTAADGTELKSAEEFTAFMAGKSLDADDRAAFEAETCLDMFANYQGVSMAEGRLWFAEVILDDGSLLKVISFSVA